MQSLDVDKAAFVERLHIILKRENLPIGRGKIATVAKLAGVSRTAAARWLQGETIPKYDALVRLATGLGVTPLWLLYGEELPDIAAQPSIHFKRLHDPSDIETEVATASHPSQWLDVVATERWAQSVFDQVKNLEKIKIITGIDSDSSVYDRGDILFVDTDTKSISSSGVYLIVLQLITLVAHIKRRRSGGITILPRAEDYEPIDIGLDEMGEVIVLGRVVGRTHFDKIP